MIITIDGSDGAGKTTAAHLLVLALKRQGVDACLLVPPRWAPFSPWRLPYQFACCFWFLWMYHLSCMSRESQSRCRAQVTIVERGLPLVLAHLAARSGQPVAQVWKRIDEELKPFFLFSDAYIFVEASQHTIEHRLRIRTDLSEHDRMLLDFTCSYPSDFRSAMVATKRLLLSTNPTPFQISISGEHDFPQSLVDEIVKFAKRQGLYEAVRGVAPCSQERP